MVSHRETSGKEGKEINQRCMCLFSGEEGCEGGQSS